MATGPVQLLRRCPDGSLVLEEHLLREIVGRSDVTERRVAVMSVVGAFRRGKSFLLNFMLRFLRAKGKPGWLGGCDEELVGFSWRGGSQRDTTGILVWPELFPVGNDLCVLLMDTQGTFDHVTSMKENTTIFAVSTLMSSVQLYNLQERIQMDDLQNLQYFVEFGRLTQQQCSSKPFQKLTFLIRDWKFPREKRYGYQGGNDLLQEWLRPQDQNPDQKLASEMIRTCFSDTSCFLMPRPGDKVSFSEDFKGKLSDIEPEFLRYLQELVGDLLSEANLVPKKIGGQEVKARELVGYMRMYVDTIQSKENEPKSLFQSTAELFNATSQHEALDMYTRAMDLSCGGVDSTPDLHKVHVAARKRALKHFDGRRKFGGEQLARPYRQKLLEEIDHQLTQYEHNNEAKLAREREEAMKEELRTAEVAAVRRYQGLMDAQCLSPRSVSNLAQLHQMALGQALSGFNDVAAKHGQHAKPYLQTLNKEISDKLAQYERSNEAKVQLERETAMKERVRDAADTALRTYTTFMDARCGLKSVPNLLEVHVAALAAATQEFNDLAGNSKKQHVKTCLSQLKKDIDFSFKRYEIENTRKESQEKDRENIENRLDESEKRNRELQEKINKLQDQNVFGQVLGVVTKGVMGAVLGGPVGAAIGVGAGAAEEIIKKT